MNILFSDISMPRTVMPKVVTRTAVIMSLMVSSAPALAEDTASMAATDKAYGLYFIEREPGVDEYEMKMTILGNRLRIDEGDSGYIIYDDDKETIYSVSHHDRSVLVINSQPFSSDDSPAKAVVEYLELADAPSVEGNKIFNYRVHPEANESATCTEVQLVESLLPEVRPILKRYQQVLSGHHVSMSDDVIDEMRGPCYYIDQIYNDGNYYDKGMPIQLWHSNERSRLLTSYKQESVKQEIFRVPENYRRFSINKDSKTPL